MTVNARWRICFAFRKGDAHDEHVDDLDLRFVHTSVELVQKHLLGECRAFP